MNLPHGKPKAHVEHDFFGDSIKIHLATRTGDDRTHVLHADGTIHTFDKELVATTEPYERPYLTIPNELARALLDALAAHYGGTSEVQTLRKDYLHERARVDRMIDHLTRTQP